MQIAEIVDELKTKKAEVERVLTALAPFANGGYGTKRTMSPEARRRISEGMKRAHRNKA